MGTRLFRGEGEVREIKAVEGGFDNEAALHALIQNNLGDILPGHNVLAGEFELGGLRIDTVAFNEDIKSFVIIEYKNVKSGGAIDQGMAYLQLLDERRADFFQRYQQVTHNPLQVADIAWDETRVVVIAPTFTKHQLYAAKRTKDPIELYRITRYEGGIMALEKVAEQTFHENREEGRQYSEEGHLARAKATDETKRLYEELKNKIAKTIPEGIDIRPTKIYIKVCSSKNDAILCTVAIIKSELNLCYAIKKLDVADDDKKEGEEFVKLMMKDGEPIGKAGLGRYMSKITSTDDVARAMRYVKEVHDQKAG